MTDRFRVDTRGRVLVAAGDLDLAAAPELGRAVMAASTPGHEVVLDMAAVGFMDSGGLNELIRVSNSGVRVTVRSPSPAVLRLFEIAGVATLFGLDA